MLGACGEGTNGVGNDSVGGQCPTAGNVRLPNASEAVALGTVKVRDLNRRPVDAFGVRAPGFEGGQLTAIFRTITSTGAEAPTLPLGSSCVGILGRSQLDETVPEDIGQVVFELEGREESMTASQPQTNPRYFRNLVRESILPVSEDATVRGGGNGSFPPFEISTGTLRSLEVSSPPLDGSFVLPATGFRVRWEPDERSDFVELTISPVRRAGDGTTGGQVVCLLADTGCFGLAANQVNFLRQSQVDAYNATLRRVRGERVELADQVEVEMEVLSEVVFGILAENNQ